MKETDDRDERMRKLFSRLPREKAPEDFEQRVARAVAGRRTDSPGIGARVRAFAIPGLAVLLVGVLSFLIYRGQVGPDEDLGVPAADPSAVEKAPPEAGARSGEDRETPAREPSGGENATTGGTAPEGIIGDPGPSPADLAKQAKTTPVRPMMGEPTVEVGAPADSLPADDSLARRDSLARLDSLARRDSVRAESPGVSPDSLREQSSLRKRE
jgi:hypothetical protein